MQTARIPLAVLIALGMTSIACTPHSVQPCLNVAAPEDDADLGPCLEVVEPPDPEPEPKSEPPEPEPKSNEQPEPEPVEMRPCLDVLPDEPLAAASSERQVSPSAEPDSRDAVITRLASVLPPDVVAKLRDDADRGSSDG